MPSNEKQRSPLKYYYVGLACFAISLGFFTLAFFGGLVVWLFMYWRIARERAFKTIPRAHMRMALPFLVISIVYLALRSYFNAKYLSAQDTVFQMVTSIPLSVPQRLTILRNLRPVFFVRAARNMTPYFPDYYPIVLAVLAVLFVKELIIRRKQARATLMWVAFTLLTLAITIGGRIFNHFRLFGTTDGALVIRYFCYPFVGMSIVLGLLLMPPPFVEKAIARVRVGTRAILSLVIVATLIAMNFNNAKSLRIKADFQAQLNAKFYQLVTEYNESMTSFLNSSAYSADQRYSFKDMLAANFYEYPSGFTVMHHNLFQLYFPHVRNIYFVTQSNQNKKLYVWLPEEVRLQDP